VVNLASWNLLNVSYYSICSLFYVILTIAVSDTSEFRPSAPAATHHRDLPVPAPETKQKETHKRKRKETPETTSHETTIVTKSVKIEGSGSRGRVRAADFNELTRSIIEETISIYRAQIASVEPFPERTDDRDTVKQAWLEVCTARNLRVELEEDIFKFVSHSRYFLLFVTMISPCRLSRVLHKQEDMLKQHQGLISCLRTRLTALDQNTRFVGVLNSYWKVPTSCWIMTGAGL
jgi:hypothetical protein